MKTEAELLELHNKVKGMYAGGGVAAAPKPELAQLYKDAPGHAGAQEPAKVPTNGPVELVSIEPGDVPDEFRTDSGGHASTSRTRSTPNWPRRSTPLPRRSTRTRPRTRSSTSATP